MNAQRRPGREPRRHALEVSRLGRCTYQPLNEGRGVNPGDTRRLRAGWWRATALNEGRGVNPGDTRGGERVGGAVGDSLNEGRGVNPGDTPQFDPGVLHTVERSTKAGA